MSKFIIAAVIGFVVAFGVNFGLSALDHAAGGVGGKVGGGSFTNLAISVGLGALSAYIYGNLAGNRRVTKADESAKQAALSFQPPAGQGQLIVYRQGFWGSAAGMNVSVDGRIVTQLKSPRFTALTLAPGLHTVSAGFGGLAGPQNRSGDVSVEIRDGETVALTARLALGALQNSIKLETVAPDEALRAKLRGMPMMAPDAA